MESYSQMIVEEATDNVQVIEIIQKAIDHYSGEIKKLVAETPEDDMAFLIACADTIRAAAGAHIERETMEYAEALKRNMVAVAMQMPGGSDDG